MGEQFPFVDHQSVVGVIFVGREGYMLFPDYSSYYTFLGRDRQPGPTQVGRRRADDGHRPLPQLDRRRAQPRDPRESGRRHRRGAPVLRPVSSGQRRPAHAPHGRASIRRPSDSPTTKKPTGCSPGPTARRTWCPSGSEDSLRNSCLALPFRDFSFSREHFEQEETETTERDLTLRFLRCPPVQ